MLLGLNNKQPLIILTIAMNDSPAFLIADDHPLFRQALQQILKQQHPNCVLFESSNFCETLDILAQEDAIDLVLLDLSMPDNNGLHSVKTIINARPDIAVLVISANTDITVVYQLLELGINGYVPKSSSFETISDAIHSVLDLNTWLPEDIALKVKELKSNLDNKSNQLSRLTAQQIKVLSLIADGKLNKQIAYELGIQETTIKQHVSAILKKLDVINRTQAGILYKQQSFD